MIRPVVASSCQAARIPFASLSSSSSGYRLHRISTALATRSLQPPTRCLHAAIAQQPKTSSNIIKKSQPVLSPAIEVRDYQKTCIEQCLDALDRGTTQIAASLPTGSGKTTIFVNLLHSIPPRLLPNGNFAKNTLIIVNGIELARQAEAQIRRLFPFTVVELEQGKNKASGNAEVTIATIQTLKSGDRIAKFHKDSIKCIIVDEAHHAVAKTYKEVLSKFNDHIVVSDSVEVSSEKVASEEQENQVPIIGFSATLARHDRKALSTVFQEIVYHYELADMIKRGWLSQAKFVSIDVDMDLSDVTVAGGRLGDFVASKLSEVVNTPEINQLIVSSWRDRAGDRKSTLVFACDIKHMRNLTLEFKKQGYDARMIYSHTPPRERRQLLDDFRASRFPVLVNCAVLTEGADVPNIDCIFLARPTRSRGFLTQMIGRGLRRSPGKEDCLIMDMLGSVRKGIVVRPTLGGVSPSHLVNFQDAEVKEDDFSDDDGDDDTGTGPPAEPRIVKGTVSISGVTYTDYDSPFDIEEDLSGMKNLHHLSAYAWVACGDEWFVLDCMGFGHFTVKPNDDGTWSTSLTRQFKNTEEDSPHNHKTYRFTTPIQISNTSGTLSEAISVADQFTRQTLSKVTSIPQSMLSGFYRRASWRSQDATVNQKKILLKKLGIKNDQEGSDDDGGGLIKIGRRTWTISTKEMTKGQAANLLTRLSHGVKKRLESRQQKQLQFEKEQRRKDDEVVRVGRI